MYIPTHVVAMKYDFSMMYRESIAGLKLHIELVSITGKIIGNALLLTTLTPDTLWKKAAISFSATDSTLKGKLNIWFEGAGKMDVDMVSLFPTDARTESQ